MTNLYKAPISFSQLREIVLRLADWEWVTVDDDSEMPHWIAVNTTTQQVQTIGYLATYTAMPAQELSFNELLTKIERETKYPFPFSQVRSLHDTQGLALGEVYDIVAWRYDLEGIKFSLEVGGQIKKFDPTLFVPIED